VKSRKLCAIGRFAPPPQRPMQCNQVEAASTNCS
jgi:hypothetical protein